MSALRVTASSFFALLIGVPLGIAIGYKASWDRVLSPFIYLSYPIPKLALLPIIMLLFGLGEISKTLMIFLIIFFPIVVDCAGAVKAMDKEVFMVLRAFGAGGKYICAKIVAPGIIPDILVSLKITTGIALSILFFAENFGTQTGLGYLIMTSWQKLDYVNLYTGILTLSLLGLAIFLILDILEKKLTAWK
jgi:NitT/TauT family transport system permease protein